MQRLGRWSAIIVIAIGIIAVIVARITRPVLLDQSEGPALSGPALPDARIDMNTASAAEMTLLPGVGPQLADRIIADRAMNGRFRSIDDLGRVPGIGEITIDRMRPYIVIETTPDVEN